MSLSVEFEKWLTEKKKKKTGGNLGASSIDKYVRAISTVSKEAIKLEVLDRSLYSMSSTTELFNALISIKENSYFVRKNEKGHNMYSVSLDHYLEFIQARER